MGHFSATNSTWVVSIYEPGSQIKYGYKLDYRISLMCYMLYTFYMIICTLECLGQRSSLGDLIVTLTFHFRAIVGFTGSHTAKWYHRAPGSVIMVTTPGRYRRLCLDPRFVFKVCLRLLLPSCAYVMSGCVLVQCEIWFCKI